MTDTRTMTLQEVVDANEALQRLLQKGFSRGKTARKMARVLRWTREHTKEFQEARKALVKNHAKRDPEGNRVPRKIVVDGEVVEDTSGFVPKNQDAWDDARTELERETVSLDGIPIIGPSDLDECEEAIEPILIAYLGPLFDWEADATD